MMTTIMTMLVAYSQAVSAVSDTSAPADDVKRSPSFYNQPQQLSYDSAARHLVPGHDHFQVYTTI